MSDNEKLNEDIDGELPEEEVKPEEENIDEREIEDELEKVEEEKEKYKDSLIRLQAEFQNFKKRTEKSKKDMVAFALESFITELLPIVDDFERALGACEDKDSFYDGVNLIYTNLKILLERHEVEEIKACGEKFDPNLHHAVIMEESEEYEPEMVVEVLQKGYKMKEKVIRPAMVKVSQ